MVSAIYRLLVLGFLVKIAGVEGRAKPESFNNAESKIEDHKNKNVG